MPQTPLLVGCASGFSGDRSDGAAAVVRTLAARGGGTLIFETLAERTLALAQLARNANPDAGYEPLLDDLVDGSSLKSLTDFILSLARPAPAAATIWKRVS